MKKLGINYLQHKFLVKYKCHRIDVSEGIDVNKASESEECDICHYWYFLNKGFKFQPYVCNRYHDFLMMSMKLNDIYILNIKGTDYHNIISRIRRDEPLNLMQIISLTEKNLLKILT